MKKIIALVLLACAFAAQAQGTATATTGSTAGSTAETSIQNVGSPTFNSYAAPQLAETTSNVRQHGLPVASAGPTYVNGPAGDTCVQAGDGFAIQTGPVGLNANKGGSMQVPCDVRARAVNGKVTGRSDTYVFMVQCQDPNNAAATEDEADAIDAFNASKPIEAGKPLPALAPRCPERLRPDWAKNRASGAQAASGTLDPFIMSSGRKYPSQR